MIAKQRHQKIMQLLEMKEYVSIQEIAEYSASSEATARRDLLKLEADGLLERLHGGATLKKTNRLNEVSLQIKTIHATSEKQYVARYVAEKYVQPESVIFLDAGSATTALIPYLANQNLTVVTNGIHHIPSLLEADVKTILLGGDLKATTQAVVGSQALEQLGKYAFDTCFLGVNSIDEQFGCSTPDEAEAAVKRLAMQQSEHTIVLADQSKFGKRSFAKFANLDAVTIVSQHCPNAFQKYANIEVLKR